MRCAALLALCLLATLAVPQVKAEAAPLWSSLPKPFRCGGPGGSIVGNNSCLGHTGFHPSKKSTWGQYTNPKGNCTNYVAYRLAKNGASNFLVPGEGNAVDWRRHARNSKKPVNDTPAVGSVAWWDGRGPNGKSRFGHVAYVEKVSPNGKAIYLSESHWHGDGIRGGSRRLVVRAGDRNNWPDKFLHIRDKPASPVARYEGYIVQWKGDKKAQKTAWLVVRAGGKLRRQWIPDIPTYQCLKARGAPGPVALPAWKLDKLKDMRGVHVRCTPPSPARPPSSKPSPPRAPAPAPKPSPKPAPAKPKKAKSVLRDDQRLLAAKNESLRSSDGRYRFVMQSDSNLVLYGPSGRPLWASNTVGRGAHHLRMQGDGNLVIYNAKDKPIWASNTPRHYNARLVVQNDGNVVIYNGSKPIWATGTDGRR